MYMTKPTIDFEKKHIIPFRNMLDIPQLEKIHENEGDKDMEIKRFNNNGVHMLLFKKKEIYESPDQDTVIVSYEETMLPEEEFDMLVNKVKPKKKAKKKPSKSEKKQEKGKRKSKKLRTKK